MRGKFLKNFTIIGSGTLISMLVGFLTTPVITRLVNPIEYGQYSIFTMYANITLMVLYLGLDQALVRYFYDQESESYRRGLLYKCVYMPIIATIGSCIIVFILSILNIWEFELGNTILILLCIYTFIQIIHRFAFLMVRLRYKTKMYSFLSIIHKVSYVAVALPLIWLGVFNNLLNLVLAILFATFMVMVISILSEGRLWDFTLIAKGDCPVSNNALLRYAYPYVFSMGITVLFQTVDKISLNLYTNYAEVGIYSSTMTLIHVFAIIQTSFNTLWAPMAVEHYTKDKEDKAYYQRANQAITIVMFFAGITLILCKDIFAFLLGEKYREAAYILPFLIFNPIMYTISETTVSGLVFMKKSKMQVVVAVVSCITNIIGNCILVPKLGCQGAAISTGVSYIVFFTMRTALSNRYFYVDYKLKKFYLLTAIVSIYALYNTFIPFNVFSIIGYMVCLGLLISLYKGTVIWCMNYAGSFIKGLFDNNESF